MALTTLAPKPSANLLIFSTLFPLKSHKYPNPNPNKPYLHFQKINTSIPIFSTFINPIKPSIPLHSLSPIIPFLQSEWKLILKAFLCSSISVACLSRVVPKVSSVSRVLVSPNRDRLLVKEGFVIVVLVLVRTAMHFLQQAFLWEAALNVGFKIRVYVFERVLKRDLGFFEGRDGVDGGDVAYRITAEGADLADTIYALLNTIVPNTLQLFAMATQMLVASPVLSLISSLVIPCICFIIAYLGEKLRKISRNAHYSVARLSSYLNEGVGKAYNELKQGEPAIERLFDLTRFHPQVIEKPNAIDLDFVMGDVKFSGVKFQYGADMPLVLDGLNLHIKPGETVALVGPSGGGKTTLMKLLLRLYDPLSGLILIDDHDIQNIKLESLRQHVALVPQNITLFSGTVVENIGYRDLMSKINMEQVERAARIANAEEFIRMLPDGYRTNIGPQGSLLSGGQKQSSSLREGLDASVY